MKAINISSPLLFTTMTISSCGGAESKSEVYQCPMKCEGEKTFTEAGKCPECKMDLEAK